MSAPAGWYAQPDGQERYWDGESWTEHMRGGSDTAAIPQVTGAAAQGPASPAPQVGSAPKRGGFYKPWMGYVGAALTGLVLGVGVGGASGATPTAAPVVTSSVEVTSTASVTSTATATTTVTATATPKSAPVAPAPTKTAAPAKTTPPAAPPVEKFKMPKLVGQNLQYAQDTLQALGSYLVDQQDASGLGRVQLVDSNWQVCSQEPAAGKKVPVDTLVVLSAVKLTESCP